MKQRYLPHLVSSIFNLPLLATPELMFEAVAFAQAHLGLNILNFEAGRVRGVNLAMDDNEGDGDGADAEADDDDDDTGVAQIGVCGPLVARTGNLQMCRRMTAYEVIGRQIQAALDKPSISRILLDIDTNGGDSRGAFELATRIRAASLIKPVHAVVNYSAFSGGYLMAAAATEISLSESGGVGSIGVIMKALDLVEAYKQAGVVVHTFARGDRKNDLSPDAPLSDGARAAADARMDEMYARFCSVVAQYRTLPLQSVIDTQAGLFYGQRAIDAGLADRLEDPQTAFDRICGLAREDRAARMSPPPGSPGAAFSGGHARRLRLAQACDATVAMDTHPQ